MKGHFIGGFVQDKWRPSTRLTVNVGARYDVEITDSQPGQPALPGRVK